MSKVTAIEWQSWDTSPAMTQSTMLFSSTMPCCPSFKNDRRLAEWNETRSKSSIVSNKVKINSVDLLGFKSYP